MRLHWRQQIAHIRGSNFSTASAHGKPRQTSLLDKETTKSTTMGVQFSAPTPNLPPSSRSGLLYSSFNSRIDPPLGFCIILPALPVLHTNLESLSDPAALTRCDDCLAVCAPHFSQGLQLVMHPLGCHPRPCLSFQAVAQLELLLQFPPFDDVLARESRPALLLECRK